MILSIVLSVYLRALMTSLVYSNNYGGGILHTKRTWQWN